MAPQLSSRALRTASHSLVCLTGCLLITLYQQMLLPGIEGIICIIALSTVWLRPDVACPVG